MEGDRVAFDAFGAEHYAERKLHRLENGTLFDVKLEIGSGFASFDGGVADAVDVDSAFLERVFEADTVAVGAVAVGFYGVGSSEG